MANRETYPASQSPLLGDISGPAGATSVTVVGIQRTPVSPSIPLDQQVLIYQKPDTEYVPTTLFSLLIEGIGESMDKKIFINGVTDGATVWGVDINGTADGG